MVPKVILRGFLFLLAVAPAAFALGFILRFALTYHNGDEWDPDMAGVFIKAAQHQLTFSDLASLHNEHRLLVPRLIYVALNYFTHWNNRPDVVAGWVELCISSAGILFLIRKTSPGISPSALAARWFLCNLLIFCPAQWENWLSAWGLANSLPVMFAILAVVVAADRVRSWLRFAVCALLAFAAAYSNGCGFGVWVVVAILIAWPDAVQSFRAKLPFLIAWGMAFVVCAATYAYHFHAPPHHDAFEQTIGKELFFLAVFSANVFQYCVFTWLQACPVIGTLLIVGLALAAGCFFYLVKSGRLADTRPLAIWFAVALFSLIAGVMGAYSRAGYGWGQGVISRYVTLSVLVPIALVNLTPMICAKFNATTAARIGKLPAFLAGMLIVIQIQGIPGAISDARAQRVIFAHQMAAIELFNLFPDDPSLKGRLPPAPEYRDEALALNKMGWLNPPLIAGKDAADLRYADTPPAGSSDGELEGIRRPDPAKPPETYGWAIIPNSARIGDAVFLTYTHPSGRQIIFSLAMLGVPKPDIASAFDNPDYIYSGWTAPVPVEQDFMLMNQVPVNAWVLNAETGKAIMLKGAVLMQLQHQ